MAVAFTKKTIVYKRIRCDTSANMRGDLDAILLSVGWTHFSTVTGGYVYLLRSPSPQALPALCMVADQGHTLGVFNYPTVSIQFQSYVDPAHAGGWRHDLIYGQADFAALGYQVVAGCCQLWISLPGITSQQVGSVSTAFGYSFAGGIPSLPPDVATECTADPKAHGVVTELWWNCGSGYHTSGINRNFRSGRYCRESWSICQNAVITAGTLSDDAYSGSLRLFPVTGTENADYSYAVMPRILKYKTGGGGAPLSFDALVGWNYQIQGQLWDAFCMSRDRPVDGTYISAEPDSKGGFQAAKWVNYMGDTMSDSTVGDGDSWYQSLYLLIGTPKGGMENVAY